MTNTIPKPKLAGRGGKRPGAGKPTNAQRGVQSKPTATIGVRVSEGTKLWYDALPADAKKALLKDAKAVIERACIEAHIV